MISKRTMVLIPYLMIIIFLAFTLVVLWQLDWIINHTLYNHNLTFSLDWARPYWMALRTALALISLAVAAVIVTGYISFKKVKKQSEKTVYLCRSCGNALSEIEEQIRARDKLPKFRVLKSCPLCDESVLDKQTEVLADHHEITLRDFRFQQTSENHARE